MSVQVATGVAEFGAVLRSNGEPMHRYYLSREWDEHLEAVNFIGLNPSTADATVDDPTIRRCVDFARRWGFGKLVMTNLYAYRATDPAALARVLPSVAAGPMNFYWLERAARECSTVVAAWGVNANPEYARIVWNQLTHEVRSRYLCLGTTRSGAPRHPLYVRADFEPVPWP